MKTFDVKVDKEGLQELLIWAKSNFNDEMLDQFCERLDKVIVFGGFLGTIIEMYDAKIIRLLMEKGVDALFGKEDTKTE